MQKSFDGHMSEWRSYFIDNTFDFGFFLFLIWRIAIPHSCAGWDDGAFMRSIVRYSEGSGTSSTGKKDGIFRAIDDRSELFDLLFQDVLLFNPFFHCSHFSLQTVGKHTHNYFNKIGGLEVCKLFSLQLIIIMIYPPPSSQNPFI